MDTSQEIVRRLTGAARIVSVRMLEETSSTNTAVREIAENGGAEGTVLIADRQTMGRGRLGRSFYSPSGSGLYMSVLLRPGCGTEASLNITTAAAAAAALAVREVTGREAKIKWVNDVYLDGFKVCGILTEGSVDPETGRLRYAVLGIGVNLLEPEGGFPEELREVAGALYRGSAPEGLRDRLAASILNRFFAYYEELPARRFMAEYQRLFLLTGLEIDFTRGGELYSGVVLGADDEARLLVRLKNGEKAAFSAGEIVVDKAFLRRLREREGKNG